MSRASQESNLGLPEIAYVTGQPLGACTISVCLGPCIPRHFSPVLLVPRIWTVTRSERQEQRARKASPIVAYPPRIVATPRILSAIVGLFSTVAPLTFRPPQPS